MHPDLVKFIGGSAVPLNMDLAYGLPRIHMRNTLGYVRKVIESAAKGFPPELEFNEIRIADPIEDYYASLKGRPKYRKAKSQAKSKPSGSKTFDVSRTDFFLTFLHFTYIDQITGERKPFDPRPVFLPFLDQGSSLYISDTRWYISPVLADRVISIDTAHIFVRLLQDRLTFSRDYYDVKVNGEPKRMDLVHSRVYHRSKDKDKSPTNPARTTMAHYLFCKHGFTGAMQKYAGCTPVVGEELEKQLSTDEWNIYSTIGTPPKSMTGRGAAAMNWFSPKIQVAVRKSETNPTSQALVAGLFYVASYFPHQITPEYVDRPEGWIAPLGYMLFSENNNRGEIEKTVYKHLASLDDYADPIVIASMHSIGIDIENIYDFFAIIAAKFSVWFANGQGKVASMYDKELTTLYFVLFDVIKAIFNLKFELKGSNKKNPTMADIEKAMKEHLRPGICYDIAKSDNHGEATTISYSGDNMAFKATATLTPQTNTSKQGKKSNDRSAGNDPSKYLHPSVAEVAAMTCMNKSDPSGRSRINHYMLLDETKRFIVRNPKFARAHEIIARNELTTRPVTGNEMVNDIIEEKLDD